MDRPLAAMSKAAAETERVRQVYERDAPRYDRTIKFFERVLFRDARQWVCSQAEGDVLEIAMGTGLNLSHYPSDVSITGVELSPAMLDRARGRAADLRREADLRVGDVTALEFPDASFDTVVSTFTLCSIPDPTAAVGEVRRVLRPGGRFVFAEHVRSPRASVRAGQRLLNPLTVRFQADHLLREPLDYLEAHTFTVDKLERYGLGIVERGSAQAS
jgi:ubiquinone/menaquinone biosynthesis C-methylase UbiE